MFVHQRAALNGRADRFFDHDVRLMCGDRDCLLKYGLRKHTHKHTVTETYSLVCMQSRTTI